MVHFLGDGLCNFPGGLAVSETLEDSNDLVVLAYCEELPLGGLDYPPFLLDLDLLVALRSRPIGSARLLVLSWGLVISSLWVLLLPCYRLRPGC